jgi:hypothetical protein
MRTIREIEKTKRRHKLGAGRYERKQRPEHAQAKRIRKADVREIRNDADEAGVKTELAERNERPMWSRRSTVECEIDSGKQAGKDEMCFQDLVAAEKRG